MNSFTAIIVLLGVLVFVHESGHYLVGRLCGIAVETFSIGFGPKIFGFRSRGTEFRLALIPLGGYVKFAQSHPSEEVPAGLAGVGFLSASLWKRSLTILAGPVANFLLAIGVYAGLGFNGIPHPPALIGDIVENSPAQKAGLQYGDQILEISSEPIRYFSDMKKIISGSAGKQLDVVVKRDGQNVRLTLTPESVEGRNIMGNLVETGRAGVGLARLSSVVSIPYENTPSYIAGLRTGDRVTAISSGDQRFEIRYFTDLLTKMNALRASGKSASEIQFEVQRSTGLGAPTETETFAVDVSKASASMDHGNALGSALGIYSGQLTVLKGKEGQEKSFNPGDMLVSYNGTPIRNRYHLAELEEKNSAPKASIGLVRDHKLQEISVNLKEFESQRPEGKVMKYFLALEFLGKLESPDSIIEQYRNPFAALWFGTKETVKQTGMLVYSLTQLVTGQLPLKALGGPIMIAQVASESAKRGIEVFLGMMAMISINLGVLNLVPIPVLDGGQLVLIGLEKIKRKPLPVNTIENYQKIGFVMIMALVVLATYNDLSRFWASMVKSIFGAA